MFIFQATRLTGNTSIAAGSDTRSNQVSEEGTVRNMICATALLVLAPAFGLAQDSVGSWGNLESLRVGQKIEIVDTGLKKVKGRFRGFSRDGMTLDVKHKQKMALEREQVLMVRVRSSWVKQLLAGLLVGALIGSEAWLAADRDKRERTEFSDKGEHGLSARSAAYFAGAGAGVVGLAAAFSGDSGEVIYFHNPTPPRYESPVEPHIYYENAGKPEGGNVFVPIRAKEDGGNTVFEKSPANPD